MVKLHPYEVVLRIEGLKEPTWGEISNWLNAHIGSGEYLYEIDYLNDRMILATRKHTPWVVFIKWEDSHLIARFRFQNEHHLVQFVLYWGDLSIPI